MKRKKSVIDPKLKEFLKANQPHLNPQYSWMQRKEIAIWSAVVFYVLALVGAFNVINDNLHFFFDYSIIGKIVCVIGMLSFLVLFGLIAFAFIHSQFGQIYSAWAFNRAFFELYNTAIEKGTTFKELVNSYHESGDDDKDELLVGPPFFDKMINDSQAHLQNFKDDKYRVLKLVYYLLRLRWGGPKRKRFWNDTNTQEASIYTLLLMTNSLLLISIILVVSEQIVWTDIQLIYDYVFCILFGRI